MARKKTDGEVLKNGDETSVQVSIDPNFRNISSSRRSASKDRLVSMKELAGILDRDRNTVSGWTSRRKL